MKRKNFFAYKKKHFTHRGAGQAVAALVMALAVAIGGGSTTALLISQPTGLTVESVSRTAEADDEQKAPARKGKNAADETPAAASQPETKEKMSASSAAPAAEEPKEPTKELEKQPAASEVQQAPSAVAPAASETQQEAPAASETTGPAISTEITVPVQAPAEETPTQTEPSVPADEAAAEADPALEEENRLPHLVTETPELAAEDPEAPTVNENAPEDDAVTEPEAEPVPQAEEPTVDENVPQSEAETAPEEPAQTQEVPAAESQPAEAPSAESEADAAPLAVDGTDPVTIETENGTTVLLTPEEIRAALDAGVLDESDEGTATIEDENGFLRWLWNWFFGIKDDSSSSSAASSSTPVYSGWHTEKGKTYYYSTSTHKPLTGVHSINSVLYYFDANGVQQNVTFGIDVSKYQSSIDFSQVKQSGVEFVIIRIGYRGYGSGTMVQDPLFEQHFTNARNAGLRVGVYFFSQAVNENEAREEAQACLRTLNGRGLDYPIYFDTEASGGSNGRADGLGRDDRTKCAIAFCEEVKAAGYRPGVYASTLWFNSRVNLSALKGYSIWNANYGVAESPIACDLWQGSCTARVHGYSGQIDVNVSYIG